MDVLELVGNSMMDRSMLLHQIPPCLHPPPYPLRPLDNNVMGTLDTSLNAEHMGAYEMDEHHKEKQPWIAYKEQLFCWENHVESQQNSLDHVEH
ncbi:hypothetical protein D3C80_1955160 [compost metagenome]